MSRVFFFLWHPQLKPIWVPRNPTWIPFRDKIHKYPTKRCNGIIQAATCTPRQCHAACPPRTRVGSQLTNVQVNEIEAGGRWSRCCCNGAQNCPGRYVSTRGAGGPVRWRSQIISVRMKSEMLRVSLHLGADLVGKSINWHGFTAFLE